MIASKALYLKTDLNLLKGHFQVPITFPKDFFSVILEKGKEGGMQLSLHNVLGRRGLLGG
jgi:hypothetical protein